MNALRRVGILLLRVLTGDYSDLEGCPRCGLTYCPRGAACYDLVSERFRRCDRVLERRAQLLEHLRTVRGKPIPIGPRCGEPADSATIFYWYSLMLTEGYGE